MSFRPPFPSTTNAFSSINATNNLRNLNVVPHASSDTFQENVRANFRNTQYAPPANLNRFPVPPPNSINAGSNVYNNVPLNRPPDNMPPLSHPNLMNTRPHNLNNFPPRLPNVNPSFRPFQDQSCIKNTVPPIVSNSSATNFNFEHRNISMQQFPPSRHNVTCNSLPLDNNYPRFQNNSSNNYPTFQNSLSNNNPINVPVNLSNSPQFHVNKSTTNIINIPTCYSVGNTNSSLPQHAIYATPLTRPAMLNSYEVSSNLQNNFMQMPLQLPQNNALGSQNVRLASNPVIQSKETKIAAFLSKFSVKQKENKEQVTVK